MEKFFENKKNIIVSFIVFAFIALGVSFFISRKSENPKDYMLSQRYGFTATLLKDGRVLIAGGEESKCPNKAEIYNPKTHQSHYVGSLNISRTFHKAILLDDGRVLIVGGLCNPDQAELYNPKTEKFTLTGKLNPNLEHGRIHLVKLNDGRILLFCYRTIEIYNPKTGKFKFIAISPYYHNENAVALLPNNNVIIMGMMTEEIKKDLHRQRSSILFNTATNKFIKGPDMVERRRNPQTVMLKDGKILILGGDTLDATPVQLAEIYDPKTNKFYNAGFMKKARVEFTPVKLPNDNIYIPSGDDYDFNDLGNLFIPLKSSCEQYNSKKQMFYSTKTCTNLLKYEYSSILLNNGKLLIIGGGNPRFTKKQNREIEIINTKEIK